MKIIAGTADTLPAGLLFDIARYRHQIFVERLGWELEPTGQLELDQFDRRDTCYVAATNNKGELVGIARLLPTLRPYLLQEVFPGLMGEVPMPHASDIWELSRFAALDPRAASANAASNFASALALDVLAAAMAVASEAGVSRLISVSPVGIERILRHAGVRCARAAPPLTVAGRSLIACWIEVDRHWRPLREQRSTQRA